MKPVLTAVLGLLFSGLCLVGKAWGLEPIRVAVDIDKTLFLKLRTPAEREEAFRLFPNRVITLESGEQYVPYPGAAVLMENLSLHPDLEVIVWSAGPEARSRELLTHLKTASGKSVLEHVDRVLGFEDLSDDEFGTRPPASETERANRQTAAYLAKAANKDPRFARTPIRIEMFALVDDHPSYMPTGFEDQLILVDWSGWTFERILRAPDWDLDSPLVKARSILLFAAHHYRTEERIMTGSQKPSLARSLRQAVKTGLRCGLILNTETLLERGTPRSGF